MKRSGGRHRPERMAVLDVGTSKICCMVVEASPNEGVHVLGLGIQASHGVRSGGIVDMESVETAILNTVHAAENAAGETIQRVIVNLSSGQPASQIMAVDIPVSGDEVTDQDVRRVLEAGSLIDDLGERELIHPLPVDYSLDDTIGIRDPRGMVGSRLGVNMHLVTTQGAAVRNLAGCLSRCHLDIGMVVLSPIASGLASLVADEKELGTVVVDMGGGVTSFSVFVEGHVVFADCVPLGGSHVTNDIARGLSTPLTDAERLKSLHGSAIASPSDEKKMLTIPQIGEDSPQSHIRIDRSVLVSIIQPRIEETLEMVRDRLIKSGFDRVVGKRMVLCGGASQLQGVREMAGMMFDKQVRIGRPHRLQGLGEVPAGPELCTAAGLVEYAQRYRMELPIRQSASSSGGSVAPAWLGKVGSWLKENF